MTLAALQKTYPKYTQQNGDVVREDHQQHVMPAALVGSAAEAISQLAFPARSGNDLPEMSAERAGKTLHDRGRTG